MYKCIKKKCLIVTYTRREFSFERSSLQELFRELFFSSYRTYKDNKYTRINVKDTTESALLYTRVYVITLHEIHHTHSHEIHICSLCVYDIC